MAFSLSLGFTLQNLMERQGWGQLHSALRGGGGSTARQRVFLSDGAPSLPGNPFCHLMRASQIKFHLAGQTQAQVALPNAACSPQEGTDTHGTEDAMSHWGSLGQPLRTSRMWELRVTVPSSCPPNQPHTQGLQWDSTNTSLRVHWFPRGTPSLLLGYIHPGKLKLKLLLKCSNIFRYLCFNLKRTQK